MKVSIKPPDEPSSGIIIPVSAKEDEIVIPEIDKHGEAVEVRYKKPTDPKDLETYKNTGKDFAATGLAQFYRSKEADLDVFAGQLGVEFAPKQSLESKKVDLKYALIERTAGQMGLKVSDFVDLFTYQTARGDDHLMLAPNTQAKLTHGLDLIADRQKFTGKDLRAYAQIKDIGGRSKAKVEDLRKIVINHYIEVVAAENLTRAEKDKFKAEKIRDKYLPGGHPLSLAELQLHST